MDLILLGHVMILWIHCHNFSKFIKFDSIRTELSWWEISDGYNSLVYMANIINNVIGTNAAFLLLETITDYAIYIHDAKILVERIADWKTICDLIFFCWIDKPAILLLSASLCSKVDAYIFCYFSNIEVTKFNGFF